MHEHPRFQFPGTGFEHDTGSGEGCGTTVNVPLLPGSGDDRAGAAFSQTILPAVDQFKPQFLLVSAGFDAIHNDPLGGLSLTHECFVWMAEQLCHAAGRHCDGRLVSILEGGYNLQSLARCVSEHIEVLSANMR